MTEEQALKSIREDGIRLGAGDFVDLDALKIAAHILDKKIKGELVEVIRCKECRWFVKSGTYCRNVNGSFGLVLNENWFCCAGERASNIYEKKETHYLLRSADPGTDGGQGDEPLGSGTGG